jgi:hypothetical protein
MIGTCLPSKQCVAVEEKNQKTANFWSDQKDQSHKERESKHEY